MNDDVYILGIETSCDETSISIVKNGHEEIATTVLSQMDIHASFGGVVPEIASRMHVENITMVLEETLEKAKMTIDQVNAIAVTYAPGLIGSLIIGVEFAKTLAYAFSKPLIPVHHIAGHIYANNLVKFIQFPSLALVVSGGHTDLILLEGDYNFKLLGHTLDDAVGETFDKVARVLGLSYPGGPNLEALALEGKPTFALPLPMNNDSLDFSYSGLKSAVINIMNSAKQKGNYIEKSDMAASFQRVAIEQLIKKTELAIKKYRVKNLVVGGGVSANNYLRQELIKLGETYKIDIAIPPLKYCTDNAAMIATAAYPLYFNNAFGKYSLNPKSQEEFFKETE